MYCTRYRLTHQLFTLAALLLLLPWGVQAQDQTTRIIFLHHSCGHNLIEEGGVREGFTARGYEFYDHGYNGDGLRLADGTYTGTSFDVPDDNTDPDGFATIFSQPLHDPPDNTFSHLMAYDVIAFKSCFPTSNIASDEQLAEYQSYYTTIRNRIDQYPYKIFVLVTQPPQVPGASESQEARRARTLANWLQSDEYLADHPNLFVFDFFGLLAGDDDFLRPEYRYDDYDAHPNERANRDIGPLFVSFVDEAVQSYQGGGPRPTPIPTQPIVVAPPPAAGTIDDFESAASQWDISVGEHSSTSCEIDAGVAYGGAASLRIRYNIEPWEYGWCGRSFDDPQDWSSSGGLSLWLRAEEAGPPITLAVISGNPEAPTIYQVSIESPEEWTPFYFPWADFARVEWADEGSPLAVDPAQVTGIGFTIEAADDPIEGTFWVDDVARTSGTTQPPPAPEEPEEPVDEPVEEEPNGGLCPFSALALPLGALAMSRLCRPRRSESKQ